MDSNGRSTPLGVIEGFYGRPYLWPERRELVEFLAAEGYDHYLYAPKADPCLRTNWTQEHSPTDADQLRELGAHCKRHHLEWGIGLSPSSYNDDRDEQSRDRVCRRVEQLLALSIDRLALLFDDVRGHPGLAQSQCEIVDSVRRRFAGLRLMFCPTYYSTSAVLDRVFGQRPPRYLEQLGQGLDPSVDVFWTGPDICSESYPDQNLADFAAALGRAPWIWDNYPVNDGPRMSGFLHLRGFPPRTRDLIPRISGISVNPMNQAWLSRLPLATLPLAIGLDAPMDREQSFLDSGRRLLPGPLLELLRGDLGRFQDEGLDTLSPRDITAAIDAYSRFDHPAAREVVGWLRGETRVAGDGLTG